MSRYATTYSPDDDDDIREEEEEAVPDYPSEIQRRQRTAAKTRFMRSEFAVSENYCEFYRAGIPENAPELLEEFLRQFPSPQELARLEAKGIKIAAWLNEQLLEAERLCLRIDALVKNFKSLEKTEALLTQLNSTAATAKLLQAKLDDQLFPWLTKTNLKKNRFTALAFFLIVLSVAFFVKYGSSSLSNQSPTTSASPTPTTKAEPRADG